MYNLIMSGAEGTWENPTDSFSKSRFLEYTVKPIADRFKSLDSGVIAELLAMPTLFAYERYVNQPARVGRLTNLQHLQNNLHITYAFDPQIPPISSARLDQLASALDIESKYEFNRTHWAIKDINLAEVLVREGIVAAAPLLPQPAPPKVFIMYSWDSPEHRQWVAQLASVLRSRGIDVILDQWHLAGGQDMAAFMEQSIRAADRVLVICTEGYFQKAQGRKGGAGYEYTMVTGALMGDLATTKFIPVVRQLTTPHVVPNEFAMRYRFDLSDGPQQAGELESLSLELHGMRPAAPPLGPNPYL